MAFVKTKPKKTPGRGYIDDVTMGVYLADSHGIERKSVVFRFSPDVLNQLGWNGDPPTRVSVLEGTGSDTGFLQVVVDQHGYSVTGTKSKTGQSRSITMAVDRFNHYVLNEPGPIQAERVQFSVEADYILIECPDWLRFNPLTAPAPEPAPEPPQDNREWIADLGGKPVVVSKRQSNLLAASALQNTNKSKRPFKR